MRNPLRRLYGRGDLHFVTFSCYRRRRYLGTHRARHRFVKILNQVRSQFRFLLIGYAVMPEHMHLLISESNKGNPSKMLQVPHAAFDFGNEDLSESLRHPPRSPCHGRLWPIPAKRVDVRRRHTHGPARGRPPSPNVAISAGRSHSPSLLGREHTVPDRRHKKAY